MQSQFHCKITALVFLLALAGCAKPVDRTPVRYKNVEQKFSLEFPGDWKTRESKEMPFVTGIAPTSDKTEIRNITVAIEPFDEGLDSFFAASKTGIQSAVPNAKFVAEGDGTIGGMKAKWAVMKNTVNELALEQLTTFAVQGKKGISITGTATDGNLARHRPEFERILSSFKLEE